MNEDREYEPKRLGELIVYVAQRSLADRHFGRTKLNKILFFADFEAYRRLGQSITGAAYQRLPQGPCPHQLLPVIEPMLGRDVQWVDEPTFAGVQRRLVPLRSAELDAFSGPEIALVEQVLDEFAPLTNQQASDRSHETVAWRMTEDRDEIPYAFALLSHEPARDVDLDWLEEVGGEGVAAQAG